MGSTTKWEERSENTEAHSLVDYSLKNLNGVQHNVRHTGKMPGNK